MNAPNPAWSIQYENGLWFVICDVIKQNESELADTVFKIQPNKADSYFCFLLFVQSFNCLYLWNQLSNLCGVFTKLSLSNTLIENAKKPKIIFFDFRLILLDCIIYYEMIVLCHFIFCSNLKSILIVQVFSFRLQMPMLCMKQTLSLTMSFVAYLLLIWDDKILYLKFLWNSFFSFFFVTCNFVFFHIFNLQQNTRNW